MQKRTYIFALFILFVSVLCLKIFSAQKVSAAQSSAIYSSIKITVCGNNIKESGEQCDNTDLGGASCPSLGFSGGTLSCGVSCDFNTTSCSGIVTTPVVYPTGGDASVGLSWTASQGFSGWTVSGYNVGISTTSGGPYTFTEAGNTTTKNYTGLTNGTRYYFVVRAEDTYANSIVTSTEVSSIPTAPIAITPVVAQVVITNSQLSYTIDAPSTVTNPSIDLSVITITSGGTKTASLGGSISLNADTSIGHVDVDIPAGVSISGPASSWSGAINLPQARLNSTVTPTATVGTIATVSKEVEVGAGDVSLALNRAARIVIPGEANKLAGYSTSGVFTKITDVCSGDFQSVGDSLLSGGDCKLNAGSDLVIWTRHFSTFVTYTEVNIVVPPPPPPPASGAGAGGSGAGGGGVIVAPVTTSVVFTGNAYPKSTVTLLKDAQVVATTVAGPDAIFSISTSGLSGGNYLFSVYSEDSKGVRSALQTFPVSVTAGATTNVSGIFIAPTISVDKSEVKKGDPITIFGQSIPNGVVTITINSDQEFFNKTTANTNGVYLFNFDTTVLETGQHSAKSRAASNGAITSFSSAVGFTVGTKNVQTVPTKAAIKGDANNDGRVNLIDFSIEAYWYRRPSPPSTVDLNKDGKVDLTDLSIMAYNWTG